VAHKNARRRARHIPQRTCIACRQIEAKGTLIRLVRTPNGVEADPSGKTPGRGAYLHIDPDCWQRGLAGGLEKALRTELSEQDRVRLTTFFEQKQKDQG
jgi:hypothetical protein